MSAGEPRLEDTGRGLTIRYRGRYLYSTRDPRAGPRRQAAQVVLYPGTLVYVPCLGLGYGLEELARRLPENCHVLCVEADPALMAAAVGSGVELPQDDRLTVVRLDAPGQAAAVLHSLSPWRFRRLLAVPLSRGYQLYRNTYGRIQEALEEELRVYWQNKITLMDMSRLWLKNLFTNLVFLPEAPPLESLRSTGPIVVTGAGPSLERSLEEIRHIRERVRVLASDTSLPTLVASGIRPDYVCVLESQLHNLWDFVPTFDPSLYLLCDLTSAPVVLRRFPNRAFYTSRFHPLRLFGRLEQHGLLPTPLPPLGSVGVSAVQLAMHLTSGPVVLAGMDFAYRPGQTHARGTAPHLGALMHGHRLHPLVMDGFEAISGRRLLRLPGRGEEEVISDLVLRSYSFQLQRLVEQAGRVYDLGAHGLPCGAAGLGSRQELERLLRDQAREVGQRGRERSSAPARVRNDEQVRRFYGEEAGLLRHAEVRLRELIASGAGLPRDAGTPARGTPSPTVPEWLEEVAYLMLPLPESDPARLLSRPALGRVLCGARYFAELLERAAAPAGQQPA